MIESAVGSVLTSASSGIKARVWPWLGSLLGMLFVVSLFAKAGYPSAVFVELVAFLGIPWEAYAEGVHDWLNEPVRRSVLRNIVTLLLVAVLCAHLAHSARSDEDSDLDRQYRRDSRLMSAMWMFLALLGEMNSLSLIGFVAGVAVYAAFAFVLFKAFQKDASLGGIYLGWSAVQALTALLYVPLNLLGVLLIG